MNWFDSLSSSSGPLAMAKLYLANLFNGPLGGLAFDVVLILAFHAVNVYFLTLIFMNIVHKTSIGNSFWASFSMYFLTIFLVLLSHLGDILLLSISLDSIKVFADPLHTLYYVVGLYTTVGSNFNPAPEWQGLSLIIPFCGLFAFSLSGSALFTMLGFFLALSRLNPKKKDSVELDQVK